MADADVVGTAGVPGRGPFMVIFVKLDRDRIAKASFQTYGCGPAIAAGSLLTEKITGATLEAAQKWGEAEINDALGGLPSEKRHCSALAAEALRAAIEKGSTREEGIA